MFSWIITEFYFLFVSLFLCLFCFLFLLSRQCSVYILSSLSLKVYRFRYQHTWFTLIVKIHIRVLLYNYSLTYTYEILRAYFTTFWNSFFHLWSWVINFLSCKETTQLVTILSFTFIFYMQDGTKHRLLYQFSNILQLSNNVPNRGFGGGGHKEINFGLRIVFCLLKSDDVISWWQTDMLLLVSMRDCSYTKL